MLTILRYVFVYGVGVWCWSSIEVVYIQCGTAWPHGTISNPHLIHQELIAIQQNGPKAIGFFGTRNMGFLHQQLIEILSYAMVLTVRTCVGCAHCYQQHINCTCVHTRPQGNHIYTSGATGTNAAVIRGALRAENAELLTVVLPQSLRKQPAESQDLLSQVENVVEMPQNDELPLLEASRYEVLLWYCYGVVEM